MNIYFSFDDDYVVKASITQLSSEDEVRKVIKDMGSDEKVITLISQKGEGLDVLEAFALLNGEVEGSICQELEKLLGHIFSQGMSYGELAHSGFLRLQ